jgi:hypothetical protein
LPVVPPPEPVVAQSVELLHVVIVPTLFEVALLFMDRAAAVVQLKQYRVLAVKFELVNCTIWPLIWLDALGAVMPGQAAAPAGQPVELVPTVQSPVVELTVYPVGNVTATAASVCDALLVVAQTVPVVAWLAFIRSKRTIPVVRAPADARCSAKGTNTCASRTTI